MKFVDWVKGWHLVSVAIVSVLITLVVVRWLGGTEPEPSIPTAEQIENRILEDLDRDYDVASADVSVQCPDDFPWEAGRRIYCTIDEGGGQPTKVAIHMEADGSYLWTVWP